MDKHLYLVATPIGNLNDISKRAIDTLSSVDYIACEDTRNTRKLLNLLNIDNNNLFSYHNFNENEASLKIIELIKSNKSVAVVSDAGYPLISDPGFKIVELAINNNIKIEVIPGPSALNVAICASGLDTSHHLFYGFLSKKQSEAKEQLESLKDLSYTLIFYEAPHRIEKTLNLMYEVFGNRKACIARELTKHYEQYIRDTLENLKNLINLKGEIVVIVEGNKHQKLDINYQEDLNLLLKCGVQLKTACKYISQKYKLSKNDLYNKYIENNNQ